MGAGEGTPAPTHYGFSDSLAGSFRVDPARSARGLGVNSDLVGFSGSLNLTRENSRYAIEAGQVS